MHYSIKWKQILAMSYNTKKIYAEFTDSAEAEYLKKWLLIRQKQIRSKLRFVHPYLKYTNYSYMNLT